MDNDPGIFVGKGEQPVYLLPRLANRHGLIAGATGTGKTVSLQILAEAFSRRGVPVFLADVIKELGVGEALVSTLGGKGIPGRVERVLIRPPASRLGPATRAERDAVLAASMFSKRYDQQIDRRSAYEMLNERAAKAAQQRAGQDKAAAKKTSSRRSNRQGVMEAMLKSMVRSIGSSLGRQISRGVLGSILKR